MKRLSGHLLEPVKTEIAETRAARRTNVLISIEIVVGGLCGYVEGASQFIQIGSVDQ